MWEWWLLGTENRNRNHNMQVNEAKTNEWWLEAWYGKLSILRSLDWATVAHLFYNKAYKEEHSHIVQEMLELHSNKEDVGRQG